MLSWLSPTNVIITYTVLYCILSVFKSFSNISILHQNWENVDLMVVSSIRFGFDLSNSTISLCSSCQLSINTYYVHLKSITESAWSSNSWTISFCPWMHAYINAIISSIPLALWSTLSEWNVSFTASQQKCQVSKVVWCIEINGSVQKFQ